MVEIFVSSALGVVERDGHFIDFRWHRICRLRDGESRRRQDSGFPFGSLICYRKSGEKKKVRDNEKKDSKGEKINMELKKRWLTIFKKVKQSFQEGQKKCASWLRIPTVASPSGLYFPPKRILLCTSMRPIFTTKPLGFELLVGITINGASMN